MIDPTTIGILWALGAIIVAATSNPNNPAWGNPSNSPPPQLSILFCALIWPIALFFYWTIVAPRNQD